MAQPGGRHRAPAAHFSAHASRPASVVAGRETDCLHCHKAGKPWKIYIVPTEGGAPEQVMTGGRHEGEPTWSPDGNSLAFGCFPWLETGGPGTFSIHVVDLKTRQVSMLAGSEGLYSPRWSPDGRYIAALPADSEKLMLFDLNAKKWSELASALAAYPSWSRDGQYIYFEHPGSDPALLRVRVRDRKVERVVSLKGMSQTKDWGWMGLDPDDSPLVLRDVGTQEIYALDVEFP